MQLILRYNFVITYNLLLLIPNKLNNIFFQLRNLNVFRNKKIDTHLNLVYPKVRKSRQKMYSDYYFGFCLLFFKINYKTVSKMCNVKT